MHATHRASAVQQRMHHHVSNADSYAMFNLLTAPELFDRLEALLPEHRERLFPPTETLSMFLAQALSADGSCRQVVDDAMVKRVVAGMTPGSTDTGGYCKARSRLPLSMVSTLTRETGGILAKGAASWWHWRGRRVRLVDGATVTLADTPANQGAYPQPGSQKPGLGFPMCRVVALMCLGSGALLDTAMGPCAGKGSDEQSLLREVLDSLEEEDILLGDAFYATYFLLAELIHSGVDGVFEQHGARKRSTDFSKGKRLGTRDHIIVLSKPKQRPEWMSPEEYGRAPDTINVRELHAGGKVMVTTLLSAKDAPKSVLKALYRQPALERGTGLSQYQDHSGYGASALQDPGDGAQGIVGLLARLQPDTAVDGPSGLVGRPNAAPTQLQTYGADLDPLAATRRPHPRSVRHPRLAGADRRAPGGTAARPN